MNIRIFISAVISLLFFISCSKEKELTQEEKEIYSEKGAELVMESFNTLKSHLIFKMEKEGIGNAIKYCNLKALPLMDSLSKEFDVKIRRTSLKVRNPVNKPIKYEEDVLLDYQAKYQKGEKLIPILKKYDDNSIVYYSPIILDNPICLNCHGPKKIMVTEPNEKIIKSLYPTDEATGYNIGDFRGMWSVKFKLKK